MFIFSTVFARPGNLSQPLDLHLQGIAFPISGTVMSSCMWKNSNILEGTLNTGAKIFEGRHITIYIIRFFFNSVRVTSVDRKLSSILRTLLEVAAGWCILSQLKTVQGQDWASGHTHVDPSVMCLSEQFMGHEVAVIIGACQLQLHDGLLESKQKVYHYCFTRSLLPVVKKMIKL